MKRYLKIWFSVFLVLTLIVLSVVSSFAASDSKVYNTYQATAHMSTFIISGYQQGSTIPVTMIAAFTDSIFIDCGNYIGIDLAALLEHFKSSNTGFDFSNCYKVTFYFSFPASYLLPWDFIVMQNIPGFIVSSVTANGKSLMTDEAVNNYALSLRNSFSYLNNTYSYYDSAAYSSTQTAFIYDLSRISFTIESTSDDDNNGYQFLSFQDLMDSGPYLVSFGPYFYYYAQAQQENQYEEGYRTGWREGTADVADKVNDAYQSGKDSILNSSYGQDKFDEGYEIGLDQGKDFAFSDAYWDGYDDGVNAVEGFNLALIPEAYIGTAFNYIVQLFDFNLFGWSILGVVGSLMVVIVVVWILKKFKVL